MNFSFQKNLIFFFLLLAFSFATAQSLEEEIAKKSCECIQLKRSESQQISQAEIKKCISKSSDEVLKSKDPQEVKRLTKNMEEVVERLKTIYVLVEKCLPQTDSK